MRLDDAHPMNTRVLRHLSARARSGAGAGPLTPPGDHPDPYMGAGSHPDIVERVWDVLGSSLPVDCRALVHGTPALVHPMQGVVLAVCYGTRYAIRVPADALQAALDAGCATEHEWAGGGRMRIDEELGAGWVFGCWAESEKRWLAQAYRECTR